MIVKPDVYVYTKAWIHGKTLQKTQENKLSRGPIFIFSLPGGKPHPLPPSQLRRCVILYSSGEQTFQTEPQPLNSAGALSCSAICRQYGY